MRRNLLFGLLTLALAGCAGAEATPASSPSFVGVVGTPWLIVAKIPTCIASVLIAGPVAAGATLSNPGIDANLAESDTKGQLESGLRENCGPPYVVTP